MSKCHHCKRKPRDATDLDGFMLVCSSRPDLTDRVLLLCPEHVLHYASRAQVAALREAS